MLKNQKQAEELENQFLHDFLRKKYLLLLILILLIPIIVLTGIIQVNNYSQNLIVGFCGGFWLNHIIIQTIWINRNLKEK